MRGRLSYLSVLLWLFAGIAPLWAQPPAPSLSFELQVYLAGVDPQTGAPMQISSIPLTAVTCDLAPTPIPSGTVTNPRFLVWDDQVIAGRQCRVDRSQFLLALPVGTGYRATMTGIGDCGGVICTSVRSNTSNPFDRAPAAPVAPAGVGVRP